MVQILEAKPTFSGRLGKGMGEALPGAVEKYRLNKGLQDLASQTDLSPTERFAKLAASGATPQMIQSFTQLMNQEQLAKAMQGMSNQEKQNPFSKEIMGESDNVSPYSSLTKGEDIESQYEGFIPPSKNDEFAQAGKEYEKNPARFNNDPQKALDFVAEETARKQQIAEAHKGRHKDLLGIQERAVDHLKNHANNLGVKVPPNVYSKIEEKMINSIKPKKKGGQGLTEDEAKRIYGTELDQISREYANLQGLGTGSSLFSKGMAESQRAVKNLSNQFATRDDSENFADQLIATTGQSPSRAYANAYRIERDKNLNSSIKKLSSLSSANRLPGNSREKTLEIAPQLAEHLKNTDNSPLSIGYNIEKLGYDPKAWLSYVADHVEELKLNSHQIRELDKLDSAFVPNFPDWWLNAFTGD